MTATINTEPRNMSERFVVLRSKGLSADDAFIVLAIAAADYSGTCYEEMCELVTIFQRDNDERKAIK